MCCARWPAARGIGPCITMMVLTEWFACLVSGAPSHTCSAPQPCGPSVEAHTPGGSPLNSVRARLGAVRRSAEWLPERTSWAAMSAGYWVGGRTGSSGAPLLCPGSRWHCCDSAVRVVISWRACTPLGSGWGGTAGRIRQSESQQVLRDTAIARRSCPSQVGETRRATPGSRCRRVAGGHEVTAAPDGPAGSSLDRGLWQV